MDSVPDCVEWCLDSGDGHWGVAGRLCAPTTEELVIPFHREGLGCAKAGMVKVWVEPVDPRQGPASCGIAVTRGISTSGDGPRLAEAQQAVFAEAAAYYGCSSGTATLDLRLQLRE